MVVHGNGFSALGCRVDLEWYAKGLAENFEIKIKGYLGEGHDWSKEVRLLNRIILPG